MGLFSGVKKAFKKVAPIAGTVLGGIYGGSSGAALGGSIGGMLGGSSAKKQSAGTGYDWLDTAIDYGSSAMDIYNGYQDFMNDKEKTEYEQQMRKQSLNAYDNSLAGIQMQNNSAKELAWMSNEWSRQNMERNLQYQNTMAGTAHQREVADLKAAGLNPILSGTGGMGAGGVSPVNPSPVTAPVRSEGDAVTSAFDAFSKMASAMQASAAATYMSGAQTELTKSSEDLNRAKIPNIGQDTALKASQSLNLMAQRPLYGAQTNKLVQELSNLLEIAKNIPLSGQLTKAQINNTKQSTKNLSEIAKDLKMKGDISASDYGELMEMINRAPIGDIDKIINSFKGAKRVKK